MSEGARHGLLLPFDVDNPEFIRGFECGHVWTELRNTEDIACGPYVMHASNAEMAIRIGEATGRIATSEDLNETWIEVVFTVDPDA